MPKRPKPHTPWALLTQQRYRPATVRIPTANATRGRPRSLGRFLGVNTGKSTGGESLDDLARLTCHVPIPFHATNGAADSRSPPVFAICNIAVVTRGALVVTIAIALSSGRRSKSPGQQGAFIAVSDLNVTSEASSFGLPYAHLDRGGTVRGERLAGCCLASAIQRGAVACRLDECGRMRAGVGSGLDVLRGRAGGAAELSQPSAWERLYRRHGRAVRLLSHARAVGRKLSDSVRCPVHAPQTDDDSRGDGARPQRTGAFGTIIYAAASKRFVFAAMIVYLVLPFRTGHSFWTGLHCC